MPVGTNEITITGYPPKENATIIKSTMIIHVHSQYIQRYSTCKHFRYAQAASSWQEEVSGKVASKH